MLLGRDGILLSSHDALGVIHEEHGEEERHEAAVDRVDDGEVAAGENAGQDSEDEEDPGEGEEIATLA